MRNRSVIANEHVITQCGVSIGDRIGGSLILRALLSGAG